MRTLPLLPPIDASAHMSLVHLCSDPEIRPPRTIGQLGGSNLALGNCHLIHLGGMPYPDTLKPYQLAGAKAMSLSPLLGNLCWRFGGHSIHSMDSVLQLHPYRLQNSRTLMCGSRSFGHELRFSLLRRS